MFRDYSVLSHIAIGSAAVLFYWVALVSAKGGHRHRAWGKSFFVTLIVVAVSIAPLLFMRPGPFDPAWVVQFVYLAIGMLTVTMVGWTAIRWKNDLERFRGIHFKVMAILVFLLGGIVLAAGIEERNPFTITVSWVGLVYGGAMIRFAWMKSTPHPRWSLIWHLNAVCGLFNAVHGTVFAVAWRWAFEPTDSVELAATMQILTMLIALGLRIWFGAKKNAPLRLTRSSRVVTELA